MPTGMTGSQWIVSGFTGTIGSITNGTGGANSGPIASYDATVYSFTSGTGTFVVSAGAPVIVDYLVVGGGGGGGSAGEGGGGGAGGLVYAKGVQLPAGTYTWTVGAGGAVGTAGSASSLSSSIFGNVTALGGGQGGIYQSNAFAGGSGGGGGGNAATLGGANAIGQGYAGASNVATNYAGAGGGGAGGGGGLANGNTSGVGGSGLAVPITGSNVYYAGGGGGGCYNAGAPGAGGLGGGGLGANAATGAVAGLANTGGGGGGSGNGSGQAAAGGSGVVILRVYTNIGSRLLIGDGSGYSMALSAQSNAVTRDVMTVTDQGNVSIGLSNALFNGLLDGTFDSSGNMYICDGTNNRVRKISPAGIVTTLIGNGRASNVAGTGTEASIISPSGLVLDTSGNMWVSTLTGHQIAKVVLSTLAVTFPLGTYGTATVAAGTGAASTFASPRGLAYDSVNGYLWVAQAGVISRILISTLTSTLLSSGPSGCLALAYDGTFLYASTSTTIQKITTPGGAATTATLYTLTYPWGLCLSPSKTTLYFAQLNGGPIGSAPVPTAGTVTILAGSNGVNGSTDATGTAASFSQNVQGIFLDNLGSNIYITDFIVPKIRRLNIATSNVTTYAGTGTAGFADGSVPTTTVVNNTLFVNGGINRLVNFVPTPGYPAGTQSMVMSSDNAVVAITPAYSAYGGLAMNGYLGVFQAGTTYSNMFTTGSGAVQVFNVPADINQSAWFSNGTGKFGINCNAPAYTLDVSGNAAASTSIIGGSGYLGNLVANNPTTFAILGFNSSNQAGIYGRKGTNNNYAGLDFVSYINTVSTTVMTISPNDARVGINCNAPGYPLDVAGTTRMATSVSASTTTQYITLQQTAATDAATMRIGFNNYNNSVQSAIDCIQNSGTNFASAFSFKTNTGSGLAEALYLSSAQRVGINCNAPAYTLDVIGTINVANTGINGGVIQFSNSSVPNLTYFSMHSNTNFYCVNSNTGGVYLAKGGTSWTASSDSRMKTVLSNITNATEMLSTITPVYFTYNTDPEKKRRVGVIAQNVLPVFPELVVTNPDPAEMLGVDYTNFAGPLVAAVKELSARLSNVEAKLAATTTTA